MPKRDPHRDAHLEWIGFVRPTGLVVSAPALVRAGAILPRDPEGQRLLRASVAERRFHPDREPEPWLPDFRAFASSVLGWNFSPRGYAGTAEYPIPPELETPLQEGGEVLRPDFAVRERDPRENASAWQLIVKVVEPGEDFDRVAGGAGRLEVSAHGRMERLLRQTGVPAGLLCNGCSLRLVSAPRGESSGWLDVHVADMVTTAGRPIVAALRLLLSQTRLLSLPRDKRFAALLADSRRFQNEVSERLAEQVLHALYELLRGIQAADDTSKGELLRAPLAERPDDIYHALLTVILRLVFLLYAEERDLLPGGETFARHYSLAGLYERLREDAALHPDTLNQRYGAWAQLLVLFRLFHDGAEADGLHLPRRHGALFDPDRFPFLEGRGAGARQIHERIEPPLVPDGTIYRALDKLLVLDGERISYRALDVEQIGSVYETMMGFRLETATGRSVAIKAQKKHGVPTAVDLEALAAEPGGRRAQWLRHRTDRALTDTVRKPVAEAATVADLHAALQPVIDTAATPDLVPAGALVLQPSEARRRSGSHYTPRELTEPIVRTTLEPILTRLRGPGGKTPRPEAILDLKVCDPAMGSGAFLVEACRQLGDALIEAWRAAGDDAAPDIPPGEDEVIFARRLIAQRCLYGVDRNPMAVDLAKVSLWLATLAKKHALTFVDHALRHGDSLVGLSQRQIETFHWDTTSKYSQQGFETIPVREQVAKVSELRRQIREADASVPDWDLRDWWDEARFELDKVRLFGDLATTAFFEGTKPKERETKRAEYARVVYDGHADQFRGWLEERRRDDPPLAPFHWELEFPEVFERSNPGFDAIIGNPPFIRGKAISTILGSPYRDYLTTTHADSNASADIIAFFFRNAFVLLRKDGTFGLIGTKTISKGATRRAGLRYICTHGGIIFSATKRLEWPGAASVIVSVLHIAKGPNEDVRLDGNCVERITAFLFSHGGHEDPGPLRANSGISYNGCALAGPGFTFDDKTPGASSLRCMNELIQRDPRNAERIYPYLGGKEINDNPRHASRRHVIFFGGMPLDEATQWPDLIEIVRQRVKPSRDRANRRSHRIHWWQFGDWRPGLFSAISKLERMLCVVFVSQHLGFVWLPTNCIVSHNVGVFAIHRDEFFCVLQSRVHETFATQLSSGLEDRQGYRPSDGFDPFPFPSEYMEQSRLATQGKRYYDARAAVMAEKQEGLTAVYNRFHDLYEDDPEIWRLRDLHAAMDRAVLDAYGWTDIPTDCEFLLDYEIDEEEWGSKKKPYRYRWPDDVRDEVLARLLELNAERAAAETRMGLPSKV